MRRRNRGRGAGRGARGGGTTSSRNNSTTSNPVLGPTKGTTTTILTAFQRQSSPYIRQLRGGIGQTIKRAINSIINDNDIMNNNTFSNSIPRNGSLDHGGGKVNGVHGKTTNGEASDGYLHKKFKKVNNVDVPLSLEKNNGVIPLPNHNTLTLMKGEEERSNPPRQEKHDGHNGTNGLGSSGIPSVYKPKFRLSTASGPVEEVKESEIVQSQRLVHEPHHQFPPVSHQQRVHGGNFRKDVEPVHPASMHAAYISHSSRHVSLPQIISPGMLTNGGGGVDDKRIDRQSLDDRISKIIHDNQSILATWPEHLNKRAKGSSGRYSLSARPGTHSFGMGFGGSGSGEPSRKESLDFVMSSGTESPVNLSKVRNGHRLNGHLSRSNSDVSQHFLYQDRIDSLDGGCEDLSKHSDSFTVPKKRRRMSPVPGILSGGEVAEVPNSLPKQHLTVPSVPKPYPLHQKQNEVDMTLRVSNCGNSGAKITIRTTGAMEHSMTVPPPNHQRSNMSSTHDESSNSSSTSSSKSLFSPDPRQNMIRIRKNSIFEMDPSLTPAASVPAPIRKRGRPSKVNHEEAPKIRKVVERLQNHLNARTAALAALAASTSPAPFPSAETEKSQLLVGLSSSKPIITTAKHNHDVNKVPAALAPTISNKPEQVEMSSTSSLLLQTTALNPKRPTFLALKPANGFVAKKRLGQMDCILPSPETPRGAKNYNQMHINGNAYTYLGFKISTKSSYTCLFKPQPMFVPQETDPKLSMYSNWQPRPKDPNEETKLKLSAYDSRINFRKSGEPIFITSVGNSFDTLTINSPDNAVPKFTLLDICGDALTHPDLGIPSERASVTFRQHSGSGQNESKAQAPVMSLPRSRSPSPPPSPGTPVLTIDERPLDERINAPPSPKPVINLQAAEEPADPSKSEHSPPTQGHGQGQDGGNETHVEASTRYRKKSIYFPPTTEFLTLPQDVNTSSSSESSSADELGTMPPMVHHSRDRDHPTGKGRSISLCIDSRKNDESLDMSKLSLQVNGSKDRQRSQSASLSSPSAILNNLDSARVKIMEGGFESNEDYTYVRGRGRGRYVCESCGIRCKKPSMLRKHLKTHTDLRPYTCKLCNFSFKTKGNLTKHQKSKSHHKKCIGLGIHPESSRSLEMTGPISDSNDEGDTDDDDDDDDENDTDSSDDQEDDSESTTTTTTTDNCNDKEKFEKEIALSLLDLSQLSRLSEKRDRNISESNTNDSSFSLPSTSRKVSSFSSPGVLQSEPRKPLAELETPIDLSVKTTRGSSVESHPKFFGGIVKTMEIVGEAQPWEPEEEFLRNGFLNLTKVRNHVEGGEMVDQRPKIEISDKIQVSEPQLQPAAAEDKPFQFEITKRRRVVSMCDTVVPGSNSRTPPRNSSVSLSSASPPLVITSERHSAPTDPTIRSPLPTTSSVSRPKRLHQPWLSPQGATTEVSQQSKGRCIEETVSTSTPSNGKDTTSLARAAVERMEEELEVVVEESVPTSGALRLSLTSAFGGNGIKTLPTTSNGTSNFQGFGGLLGLKPKAEFRQPSGAQLLDEGKAECNVCGKTFSRAGQLTLHMNIHYLERPFRCEPCGVSFRTKGHLIKHRRSSSHDCKVYLTEAWGVANEENPRPFKCVDCKIAFRIHGHLAKHLRSKMHIMRMECLGKLPFGIYFEMEKSGLNLNEIDTTDCDMSLVSLQTVAQKIYGDEWRDKLSAPIEDPV